MNEDKSEKMPLPILLLLIMAIGGMVAFMFLVIYYTVSNIPETFSPSPFFNLLSLIPTIIASIMVIWIYRYCKKYPDIGGAKD